MIRARLALCVAGSDNTTVAGQLFSQLDWDGNGHISFKEFLLGLEKMVMEGAEDDEDMQHSNEQNLAMFKDAPTYKASDL